MKKTKDQEQEHKYQSLNVDHTKYKTLITKKFRDRKPYENPDISKVFSYIPGTVSKIFIQEGEAVKEGEKLLTLDAMKMKNIIKVPFDGIITKVNVSEGQNIPKGHLLVEIDLQISE